jgi:hypothetical protein
MSQRRDRVALKNLFVERQMVGLSAAVWCAQNTPTRRSRWQRLELQVTE